MLIPLLAPPIGLEDDIRPMAIPIDLPVVGELVVGGDDTHPDVAEGKLIDPMFIFGGSIGTVDDTLPVFLPTA